MDETILRRLTRDVLVFIATDCGLVNRGVARRLNKSELISLIVESDCDYGTRIHGIEELADAACELAECA